MNYIVDFLPVEGHVVEVGGEARQEGVVGLLRHSEILTNEAYLRPESGFNITKTILDPNNFKN